MIPRGIRNNNPGNIDKGPSPWLGIAARCEMTPAQKEEKRFTVFKTPVFGVRALAKLLTNYYLRYGLDTVRGIINRWAPPVENLTSAYVKIVALECDVLPDAKVDLKDRAFLKRLVVAIIRHENAGYEYPDEVIEQALDMLGKERTTPWLRIPKRS